MNLRTATWVLYFMSPTWSDWLKVVVVEDTHLLCFFSFCRARGQEARVTFIVAKAGAAGFSPALICFPSCHPGGREHEFQVTTQAFHVGTYGGCQWASPRHSSFFFSIINTGWSRKEEEEEEGWPTREKSWRDCITWTRALFSCTKLPTFTQNVQPHHFLWLSVVKRDTFQRKTSGFGKSLVSRLWAGK